MSAGQVFSMGSQLVYDWAVTRVNSAVQTAAVDSFESIFDFFFRAKSPAQLDSPSNLIHSRLGHQAHKYWIHILHFVIPSLFNISIEEADGSTEAV